ncbi:MULTISPECIES: hypothetical protein [unclassified Paraburkholderia]|uniref:hypothetical protein n=1 Tax=unclassified Paraburkholderia TaxID=2615204 RepID=UPI001621E3DF|nr:MULTISPECIES: hypothetical protein [unclassified Paraburkholderia]MBB5442050.1 hypothetical protein [Paraburkholderia sp. WSM4177]MBB5482446.1 hypothetical protein [Paraburkholderia sp. WSM4180]
MKMQVSEPNFESELSALIAGLDSFPKCTAPRSNKTSHVPQAASAERTRVEEAAERVDADGSIGHWPEHCPDSIRRLCSPALRKPRARSVATTRFGSAPEDSHRKAPAQLSVVRDGTVYELNVVSVDVTNQPGWKQDGDLVATWASVFKPGSKFRLVSSQQQFQQIRRLLSSMQCGEVKGAINAWLTSSLATLKISRHTAMQIKLVTEVPGDWQQLRVHLRPSRVEVTSDQLSHSERFTRSQEAEIRNTQSYRDAQRKLQQLWFPTPSSFNELV